MHTSAMKHTRAYTASTHGIRTRTNTIHPSTSTPTPTPMPAHAHTGKTLTEDSLTKFISKKGMPLVGQKNWKANER